MSQQPVLTVIPSTAAGADPVIEWNQIACEVIAADALPSDVAARVLAIESLAVYNAVAAVNGTPGFQSNLTAPSGASAQAAAVSAADSALDALFPALAASFDAQAKADLGPLAGSGVATGGAAGQQAAAQVLAMRRGDGAAADVTDVGATAPGSWQPAAPFFAPATTPQYAAVLPFGLLSPNQFAPPAPPAVSSSAFTTSANQTFSQGAQDSKTRSSAETQQALFWNDQSGTATTAGEWNQIAASVAQAKGESLTQAALLFAALNVAEADSAVAAANSAFADGVPRPVTLFSNPNLSALNPAIDDNPNWTPLLATPNSPGYPDDISALSSSAATVLGNVFGDNTAFAATSQSDPGVVLPFSSFSSAAADAAASQVYGGIQFGFATATGLTLGSQVGTWTLGLFGAPTAPTVVLTSPNAGTTSQDPTITGFVSPSVTVLNARLPGGTTLNVPINTGGSFAYTVTDPLGGTADGSQVISFVAANAAGGRSAPANYTFDLLTQAPTIAFASDSVTNTGSIGANAVLDGSVRLEPGDSLRSLSYAFDNGPAVSVPVDPLTNTFDAGLDAAALTRGQHKLTVTAVDVAGNATATSLTITDALPFDVTGITPAAGSGTIGVAFRPVITFSRPANPATVTSSDFYATDGSGAELPATVVPFADGTGAALIPSTSFSASSAITLHVLGQRILAAGDGAQLDAADSGTSGSTLTQRYTTVATAPAAGTTISGVVVDPGPDGTPFTPDDVVSAAGGLDNFRTDSWKLPIAGATVHVLGDAAAAVTTAADGSFTLTNVPAGLVTLVVDGTTATNAPVGYASPALTFALDVKAGENNTVAGDLGTPAAQAAAVSDPAVYLPRVATDALTEVSGSSPVTVTAPADSELGAALFPPAALSLTLVPSSIVGANDVPLATPSIGIVPVPVSVVQSMLPPGPMQNSFMVLVESPGALLFNANASMTLPNLAGLAPGEQTCIFAIDPATGQAEIVGTATASANGQIVTTDPGTRIDGPGLYGMTPAGSNGGGMVGEPARPGLAYPALVGAETQADQAVLAMVDGANHAIAGALAPALPGSGTVGAAINANAGLMFAAPASLNSDVTSAISAIAADARAVTNAPTAALGYATLASDALYDAANIAAGLGGSMPGPAGKWAAGLQAANAAIRFWTGVATTDASLQADVATMTNGLPVTAAEVPFQRALATAAAQAGEQASIYGRIANDLTTLSLLDVLDPTQPNLGVAAGTLTSIDEQLPAIANAFDDYVRAASQLAGQPTALGVAQQVASGLSAVEGAANTAAFLAVGTASPGIADNGLGVPAQDVESTLYAAIQGSDGSIQRISFTAARGYQFFVAPNTVYQVTVFDPTTDSIGQEVVRTGPSGQDTTVPLVGLASDTTATEADGLTATEAFVIGVSGTLADNLVPGMTDLAALQQGLFGGSVPANATGVVASLPLPGTAEGLALAGSSDGAITYGYVATGNGLAVVDVTNPESPETLGQVALGGNASGVAVNAALGLAAVADSNGLALVDVADPAAPRLVQTVPIAGSLVRIIGGVAFASSGGALDSVDLATGTMLQTLALSSGSLTGLAVSGSTIYAMDSNDVLRVIGTSGGTMVTEGSIALPSGGSGIFAADGVVYAGAANVPGNGGYLTVDARIASAPTLIAAPGNTAIAGGALALNGSGTGVSIQESSTAGNILSVFAAANSSNTTASAGQYTLPAQPYDLALNAGFAFVADGAAGLEVVNYLATDTKGVAPAIAAVGGPVDVDPIAAGTQVYAGAPITVTGTVTDDVQVRTVELLLNGSAVASTARFPFALTATMPDLASTATLEVEATDTGGNTTVSAPVTVQIVPDTRPFSVVGQSVTQNETLRPFVHGVTLAFSKPVDPSSITAADVAVLGPGGATVPAESLTLSQDDEIVSLNFGVLQPGTYALALTAPLIVDDNGTALGSGVTSIGFTIEQYTDQFTGTTDASWNNAANWSAGGVPGGSDSVSVGANGGAVNYDGNTDSVANLTVAAGGALNATGGNLSVSNALEVDGQLNTYGAAFGAGGSVHVGSTGAVQVNNRSTTLDNAAIDLGGSIQVTNNSYLFAGGNDANAGQISLTSVGNDTRIVVLGSLTLSQSGTVTLSDNSQNFILSDGGASTLNNLGNTIEGSGQIGDGALSLNNGPGATIAATGIDNQLVIYGGNNTNAGLLEGLGPRPLLLLSTTITGPGTVAAAAPAAVVNLQSASLVGGTLQDTNGGVIQDIDRSSVLTGMTLASGSNLHVTNNNYLYLQGTLTNAGTVYTDSVGNDTRLVAIGTVTLGGSGVVQFSDNTQNYITSNGNPATLINAGNTIVGGGQIGDGVLTLVNQAGGTIDASVGNTLIIQSGNNTNAGLLEDTGSGGLLLRSTAIANTGTIAAPVAGSVVDLQSSSVTGGTLEDANGGVIQDIDRGTTLNNVTLATASDFLITNNNFLYLAGTLTNNGTVDENSVGNDTRLIASGVVTLAGGGTVQLTDNSQNGIYSNGAAATLINTSNIIEGAGQLGDGLLALTNGIAGTIDATGNHNALIIQSTNVNNVGLLEDTGPAGLLLRSSTVINAGTISASGTQTSVSLQSASITGGVLQDAGGGVIVAVDRGSEIDSVALSIGSNLHIANNNYLTIAGSITNRGTIYEDSVGNDTRLIASGSVRLSGGGVVQLSNNGANLISGNPGSVLLNVNDTIQGAGQIGDGALSLTNGAAGTIDATGNSNVLVLTGLATTNAGLIEGTGGAGLRISSTTIDNSGTIAALVAGSNVQLFSATVVGGTLATANGGVIYQVDRGSVLNTVTLASGSLLDVTNNSFLTLAGTLTNLGTVTMSSGGSDTRLIAAGTVTLTGGGLLQLSDNSDNGLVASGVARFVNQNNVISGGGFIGDGGDPNLSFDNETAGVIDASAGNALRIVLDGGTLTNTGTIEATATSGGNGGLQIISSTIDNTGSNNAGVILATGTNSHVNLQSASILGGTLATASGGVIDEVDRGSVLNDVTVATSGRFDVLNNTFLTLAGTLANLGTVTMSSVGNDTRLIAAGTVTLTGGGLLQLSDNSDNGIVSNGAPAALTVQNNQIVGAGFIGDGNMTVTLGANGTIEATGNNGLTLSTVANTVVNGGLLQSAGPGGLSVTGGGGVANNGQIWADGSGLYIAGNVSGTGSERITGGVTLHIGGTVAAGQSASFDAGSTGTLRLDDSQQYRGTVTGLATDGSNALDLSDIDFINTSVTTAKLNNGILTVTDGSHTATIELAGNYAGQTFVTSSDGHNGTRVIDPTVPPSSTAVQPASSEIVFRNNASGDTGWYQQPVGGGATTWTSFGATSPAYSVVGIGHFTGGNTPELLFRNGANGDTGFYVPSGSGYAWHDIGMTSTAYNVVGTGDFTGDGSDDVLFQNSADGDLGYFALSASGPATWQHLGSPSLLYSVVATGDFNGSGASQILFRNNAGGDLGYYTINGTGQISGWTDLGGSSRAYSVVGVGDFTGTGAADILFRDTASGDTGYYTLSDNGTRASWTDLGASSPAYTVVQVGDFTGNGVSDILFRDLSTGDLGYYGEPKGGGTVSWTHLGGSSAAYTVVASPTFS